MITIAVGTFIHGFDELLEVSDQAVADLKLEGFAQTGHSHYKPKNLECVSFLDHANLMTRLKDSRLLICHAGMGLIGDGLRSGCKIIIYPRRGRTSRENPANDQSDFAIALAKRMNLGICLTPQELKKTIQTQLGSTDATAELPRSDIPMMIATYLEATR